MIWGIVYFCYTHVMQKKTYQRWTSHESDWRKSLKPVGIVTAGPGQPGQVIMPGELEASQVLEISWDTKWGLRI